MESGLFGLQSEASSYFAYCLILRAQKPQLRPTPALAGAHIHVFIAFGAFSAHLLSQTVAKYPFIFNRCCLSDSLLALENSHLDHRVDRELLLKVLDRQWQ